MSKTSDQDIPAEAARIMERLVHMPPKPHEDMKVGKRKAETADSKKTCSK